MVDTVRTLAALQALLADNTVGNISAQDARDFLVSVYDHGADTMADLLLLDQLVVDARLGGFHTIGDGGGGDFYYDAAEDRANHNGGTIIDPTNSADLGTWDAAAKTTWFTAGSGMGCWKRTETDAINIAWFGDKGDGLEDDTSSVQNAINAANTAGGKTVYSNNSTDVHILTTGVDLKTNVVLDGIYFKAPASVPTDYRMISSEDISKAGVVNCTFDLDGANQTNKCSAVWIHEVTDFIVIHSTFELAGAADSVVINGVYSEDDNQTPIRCRIHDNYFNGGFTAIRSYSFRNSWITNNQIISPSSFGIQMVFSKNTKVANNDLTGCGSLTNPQDVSIRVSRCDNADISNNRIEFSWNHAIVMSDDTFNSVVNGNIIQEPGWSSTGVGNDGINGDPTAGGIVLQTGSGVGCTHNIISDNVIYLSTGYGMSLVFDCIYNVVSDNTFFDCKDPGIACIASYTSITGNTFNGVDGDCIVLGPDTNGGDIRTDSCTVSGNTAHDCENALVFLNGARYSTVTGNTAHTCGKLIGGVRKSAIYMGSTSGGSPLDCSHNTVVGNTINNSLEYGIEMVSEDFCLVAGNIITGSGISDVVQGTGLNNTIENNQPNDIIAMANDATPSILGLTKVLTGGTTTITDFDDGKPGLTLVVLSEHAVTITDGTNIFLNGSVNFVMANGDSLTLIQKADGNWYETARMVN